MSMTPSGVILAVLGTLAVIAFAASMLAAIWLGVSRRPPVKRNGPGEVPDVYWGARLAALETKVEALPSLWEEERKRAENARERERAYARSRAKKERERDDEDEEPEDVPRDDAPGGGGQGMLPLYPQLGGDSSSAEPAHLRIARERFNWPWGLLS